MNMLPKEGALTTSDYGSLRYFFFEKGDMTRWTGWKEAEPKFRAAHPDLFIALNLYASAKAHLRRVVDEITSPVEESGEDKHG